MKTCRKTTAEMGRHHQKGLVADTNCGRLKKVHSGLEHLEGKMLSCAKKETEEEERRSMRTRRRRGRGHGEGEQKEERERSTRRRWRGTRRRSNWRRGRTRRKMRRGRGGRKEETEKGRKEVEGSTQRIRGVEGEDMEKSGGGGHGGEE
jgi:hypothetical protein